MIGRLSLALVLGLLAGCHSPSHFPEEERAARQQISAAEKAGAEDRDFPALRIAKNSLEYAREADRSARDDLRRASDDLENARARRENAIRRQARQRHELAMLEAQILAGEQELDKARARVEDLRFRGVPPQDIQTLTSVDQSLVELRLENSKESRATLEKELELADLEVRDAELHVTAAKSRMDAAQHRLDLARALFQQAERQARLTEALAYRRIGDQATITSP